MSLVTPPLADVAPAWARPLAISGRDPSRVVRFPVPVLLAPMEGITDTAFRDLVIGLGGVGGASTEFIRIAQAPVPSKVIRRHLGAPRAACPVGVQFMAAGEAWLAESVAAAEQAGAAFIDLNFGCPAPVVFDKCAGSALLARPERVAAIVATAVAATGLPVSAKVRAGITDAAALPEIVAAVAEGGASMLTVHARLRVQAYSQPATWAWLGEARACAVRHRSDMPVIGNGSIDRAEDVALMMAATGCDGVMIGRAALADPWIFRVAQGGPRADVAEAASFALRYAHAVEEARGARCALSRLKQLVRWYTAGGLFAGCEDERQRLLRCEDLASIRGWLLRAGSSPRP